MTIFYSWQSDTDEKINRSFIHAALKEAVKNLKNEGAFDDLEIILATSNEPGTPDIPETILKKIDECSIFIADITIINKNTEKRLTPNPNVLVELGYAIKKLGFEKIITIFNTEFGKPEELPFDINHRRPMQYLFNANMDRKKSLNELITKLEKGILLIDKKTMTKEKIGFILYDRDKETKYGNSCTVNSIIYRIPSEGEFIRGVDFNELMKLKEKNKFTDWQEYLYKEVKANIERKAAYDTIKGMKIIREGMFVDPYETKDFYKNYTVVSYIRLNQIKFDFLIKNNNEQVMKNIKIVFRTQRNNIINRKIDLPKLPSSSIFADIATYNEQENNEQELFIRKENGDTIIFEYMKDNLYAGEEYILDEPLYVALREQATIKIEYTIFSENLPNISGILEINMKNETKILTPIDVFNKL